MVVSFSFSDSGAQLSLANEVFWWASASFQWRFRSFYLALFILITSKFSALRVTVFLIVKSQAPKCEIYRSIPFFCTLDTALIVFRKPFISTLNQ